MFNRTADHRGSTNLIDKLNEAPRVSSKTKLTDFSIEAIINGTQQVSAGCYAVAAEQFGTSCSRSNSSSSNSSSKTSGSSSSINLSYNFNGLNIHSPNGTISRQQPDHHSLWLMGPEQMIKQEPQQQQDHPFSAPTAAIDHQPDIKPQIQIITISTTRTRTSSVRPKNYLCPHCQLGFTNNGQLKNHYRIHTGERPFKCEYENCEKTFTRNEELTRHKLIHTGVRPHACSTCDKRFGRKDHLKKHARTHERQLQQQQHINNSSSSSNSNNSINVNNSSNSNIPNHHNLFTSNQMTDARTLNRLATLIMCMSEGGRIEKTE